MADIQDLWCGKMSQGHSRQTRGKISKPSSKKSVKSKTPVCMFLNLQNGRTQGKSWETVSPLHGGCLMRSNVELNIIALM